MFRFVLDHDKFDDKCKEIAGVVSIRGAAIPTWAGLG